MEHTFTNRLVDFLLIRRAQRNLHDDDLASRQRLNLFRTFSVTSFVISIALIYQIITINGHFDWISGVLLILNFTIAGNYFLLNRHLNYRVSYSITMGAVFLVVHFLSYYSGGIRNSGMVYLGGFILASFMLLGNRAGKIFSLLSIIHLIFFYFFTNSYSENVRNIVDTDADGHMLNLDYMITFISGTLLVYFLSNNLENSKNIVIAKVTESKYALVKKNQELKKLSLVASNTDNSVMITNHIGEVEWANEGFTRLTGFSYDEILGKNPADLLFGPNTNKGTVDNLEERINGGQSFSGEIQKYHKDGNTFWVQLTVTPILDDSGALERFIHVESDITERKEAEEKMAEYYKYLEKANKELDKFAYVVSHDLKAPLRAISNLTVWIEEDIGDHFTEDSREHFKMLKGRVVRMEGLIQGILDYSRADRIKSPNTIVDVNELLEGILEMLVQDDKIEVEIKGKLPVLDTERMKLQQIFSNLISNSIKHNDKPETLLKITCEEEENDYLFSVEDNGPGIGKEFHEKIFVIFQTLQARDSFESTGVGLAIVKKIIDEIGGKIWVESEVGKYTRFLFRWPKLSSTVFKPFQFTLQPAPVKPETINEQSFDKVSSVA